MTDAFPLAGPWESYDDDHVCLLRPLDAVNPRDFEVVYARAETDCLDRVRCRHAVVFVTDYVDTDVGWRALNGILAQAGYAGVDGFALQGADPDSVVRLPDGRPDVARDPNYVVDMALAAREIIELARDETQELIMTPERAAEWVENLTGIRPEICDLSGTRPEPWARKLRGVRVP